MPLRIALGSMSCDTINSFDEIGLTIKEIIYDKIAIYKTIDFSILQKLPDYSTVEYNVENKVVEITFYKEVIDTENILLVIRAAYRTINMPTYFCWGFIGRVYAEGIIVNSKNEFKIPEDNLLWEFK